MWPSVFELQLSPAAHDAWAAGEPHPVAQALQGRGLEAGAAQSAADLLTQTRTSPALEARLELTRGGATVAHNFAIGPGLVAMPAPPAIGPVQVGVVATFPRLVAELIDLAPRPFDDTVNEILMPDAVADAYLGVGAPEQDLAEITELFAADYPAAALRGLLGTASTRWTLNVWGDLDRDAPQTRIDVLDAGEAGLWLISDGPTDESVAAAPVNSTTVWLLISGALDSALAESAA